MVAIAEASFAARVDLTILGYTMMASSKANAVATSTSTELMPDAEQSLVRPNLISGLIPVSIVQERRFRL
jgi:hypothetical protein